MGEQDRIRFVQMRVFRVSYEYVDERVRFGPLSLDVVAADVGSACLFVAECVAKPRAEFTFLQCTIVAEGVWMPLKLSRTTESRGTGGGREESRTWTTVLNQEQLAALRRAVRVSKEVLEAPFSECFESDVTAKGRAEVVRDLSDLEQLVMRARLVTLEGVGRG